MARVQKFGPNLGIRLPLGAYDQVRALAEARGKPVGVVLREIVVARLASEVAVTGEGLDGPSRAAGAAVEARADARAEATNPQVTAPEGPARDFEPDTGEPLHRQEYPDSRETSLDAKRALIAQRAQRALESG